MTQLPSSPRTIIVAVGDIRTRKRFSTALEHAGHNTLEVTSEDELIAQTSRSQPAADLVVLDLQIWSPQTHVAQAFKTRAVKATIVILSGSVRSAAEVRELSNLGIDSFINEHCAEKHIVPSLVPRLFPDSFDRRTSTRVTLNLPVTFRFADTVATAPTLNVSKGGLAVRTLAPLDVGTKVLLQFRLPGSSRNIEAESHVAWSDHRTGMGLQFERVEASEQSEIDQFIDQTKGGPPVSS